MAYFRTTLVTFALVLAGAAAATAAERPFMSPAIQTERDAIAVAHALHVARSATMPLSPVREEAFWQNNFTATYSKEVWEVKSKSRYSQDVAGIDVRMAAQDGRLLGLINCGQIGCPNAPQVAEVPVGHWTAAKNSN